MWYYIDIKKFKRVLGLEFAHKLVRPAVEIPNALSKTKFYFYITWICAPLDVV